MNVDRRSAGLCGTCRHGQRVATRRGSVFVLCKRSAADPSFPRYPRLPVEECQGYDRAPDDAPRRDPQPG